MKLFDKISTKPKPEAKQQQFITNCTGGKFYQVSSTFSFSLALNNHQHFWVEMLNTKANDEAVTRFFLVVLAFCNVSKLFNTAV